MSVLRIPLTDETAHYVNLEAVDYISGPSLGEGKFVLHFRSGVVLPIVGSSLTLDAVLEAWTDVLNMPGPSEGPTP